VLLELRVNDLGIVADLTVVFEEGVTAITGETGAGKTLLVEALDLLLGGRADSGLVREGGLEARVDGRFVDAAGTEVVLSRVVPLDGRSRAYVDGRPVTVGELAGRGAQLVDLHGQHGHQSLLAPVVQRDALDRFAGPAALDALQAFRAARAAVGGIDEELAGLGGDDRARARELDLLRFQIDEITAAALSDPGEDVALEAEEALLADAVAHREALDVAYAAVEGGGLDAVGGAVAALTDRAPFAELADRLRAAHAELDDLGRELRLAQERVVVDPDRLDAVRARRQQLRELCRKYGETIADVMAYANEARRRLDELAGYEERAGALQDERHRAVADAEAAAVSLTRARRDAAGPLAAAIEPHLRELAMPAARFEVLVEPLEAAGDDGADRVTFLLGANPGEPARPLAKVASGGELSRAMLAARVVLSEAPPTLVFDEVDAGIGGEAGAAVGRLMADLAPGHQVLCVTHLAQVAAFADAQIRVEKREESGRTVAMATPVTGDARVSELSRMLAGVGESEHARSHASELLARARAGR
jgi:DNA repair protein RecN (Recombination protein N)